MKLVTVRSGQRRIRPLFDWDEGAIVELQTQELEHGILSVGLVGRLDHIAAQEIDLKLTVLTSRQGPVLVDMSQLSFIASIGIRTLVSSAKAKQRRGGSMVLYRPIDLVEEVLRTAGIDTIIPIAHDMESAQRVLLAS